MSFDIRPSRVADAPHLPAIERSAGYLFRTIPDLAWLADGDDIPVERHLEWIAAGTSWVAETDNYCLVGFLCAEVAGDVLHIWELSVDLDHQRQGIGQALIAETVAFARRRRFASVTLTTFREVPWNEPAYQRMGFVTLGTDQLDERLTMILGKEIASGLPPERRCAMRLLLVAGPDA